MPPQPRKPVLANTAHTPAHPHTPPPWCHPPTHPPILAPPSLMDPAYAGAGQTARKKHEGRKKRQEQIEQGETLLIRTSLYATRCTASWRVPIPASATVMITSGGSASIHVMAAEEGEGEARKNKRKRSRGGWVKAVVRGRERGLGSCLARRGQGCTADEGVGMTGATCGVDKAMHSTSYPFRIQVHTVKSSCHNTTH